MTSYAGRAWFEEGGWPLVKGDEIRAAHFEDMRKRIFILFNPTTGRGIQTGEAVYELRDYTESPQPGFSDYGGGTGDWYPGQVLIQWGGVLYANKEKLAKNLFGTGHTYASGTEGDYLPTSPLQDNILSHDGSYYKVKVEHVAGVFADDLAAGKLEEATEPGEYTAEAWTTGTTYFAKKWIYIRADASSPFILTTDKDYYHHYDKNSPRVVCLYYMKHNDDSPYEEDLLVYEVNPWEFLPQQVEAIENTFPIVYTGDIIPAAVGDYRWQYGSKVEFKAEYITQPHLIGACWAEIIGKYTDFWATASDASYHRASPFGENYPLGGNQYSNGYNLPITHGDININPKIDKSYQAQIEARTCVPDLLKYPVNSTFKAFYQQLWELENVGSFGNWADHYQDEYEITYCDINDKCWGENESGFEFLKGQTDEYDWVWDNNHPYTHIGHLIARTTYAGVGDVDDVYPLQTGCWRKTWKYSLGRPCYRTTDGNGVTTADAGVTGLPKPFFMRDGALAAPTRGNYTGDTDYSYISDGTTYDGYIFYPNGTVVMPGSEPNITAFTTWQKTIAAKTTDTLGHTTLRINEDCTDECKAGWTIYLSSGTALADNDAVQILSVRYEDGKTYIKINYDASSHAATSIRGNIEISQRHDADNIAAVHNGSSWTYTPQYESLKAACMNEMRNVPYHWNWIKYGAVSMSFRGCNATYVGDPDFGRRVIQHFRDIAPDDWDDYPSGYNCGDGVSLAFNTAPSNINNIATLDMAKHTVNEGLGIDTWSSSNTLGDTRSAAGAFKITDVAAIDNCSEIGVRLEWVDVVRKNPDVGADQIQTSGGVSSTLVPYGTAADWNIAPLAVPPIGKWVLMAPGVFPSRTLLSHYFIGDTEIWEYYSEALFNGAYIDPLREIYLKIDYNKIPYSVMTRDFVGAFHPVNKPAWDDHNPPLPNPPKWRTEPQAYFLYVEADPPIEEHWELRVAGELCKSEDLEGSDPVQYRLVGSKLTDPETPDESYQSTDSQSKGGCYFDFPLEDLTPEEVLLEGGIPCNGDTSSVEIESVIYTKIPLSHDPTEHIEIGDDVAISVPVTDPVTEPTAFGTDSYEVVAFDTESITVDTGGSLITETLTADNKIQINGDTAYMLANWQMTEYCNYRYFAQSKDSHSPENEGGIGTRLPVPIEDPTVWPIEP